MAATTCEVILMKCSLTIRCTLSVTAVCARPSRVNLARMDSAPCSPRRPKPTWVELAHGMARSSSTCILIGNSCLRKGFTEELHELFNGLVCIENQLCSRSKVHMNS